jgi:hypothetical protein
MGSNSDTEIVRGQGLMMSRSLTVCLYEVIGGIQREEFFLGGETTSRSD